MTPRGLSNAVRSELRIQGNDSAPFDEFLNCPSSDAPRVKCSLKTGVPYVLLIGQIVDKGDGLAHVVAEIRSQSGSDRAPVEIRTFRVTVRRDDDSNSWTVTEWELVKIT